MWSLVGGVYVSCNISVSFLYEQESELAEVHKSKQETISGLTSQLSEQTSIGETLRICEHVMCIMACIY